MNTKEENAQRIKELIDPILDVFGGADGGIAFAQLCHSFLLEVFAKETSQNEEFILMITRFSKLCSLMLKK